MRGTRVCPPRNWQAQQEGQRKGAALQGTRQAGTHLLCSLQERKAGWTLGNPRLNFLSAVEFNTKSQTYFAAVSNADKSQQVRFVSGIVLGPVKYSSIEHKYEGAYCSTEVATGSRET